jgi:hypothetical protein
MRLQNEKEEKKEKEQKESTFAISSILFFSPIKIK